MFSFFKKKTTVAPDPVAAPAQVAAAPAERLPAAPAQAGGEPPVALAATAAPPAAGAPAVPLAAPAEAAAPGAGGGGWWKQAVGKFSSAGRSEPAPAQADAPAPGVQDAAPKPASPTAVQPRLAPPTEALPAVGPAPTQGPDLFPALTAVAPSAVVAAAPLAATPVVAAPPAVAGPASPAAARPAALPAVAPVAAPAAAALAAAGPAARQGWMDRLRFGLRKTGQGLTQVFTGTKIDDALYEELEAALLMADAGVKATEFLLQDLKRRVKEAKATDPALVKGLLADGLSTLLKPLEKGLEIGRHEPTVVMVVGVNGAGKTTSIGKLTKHLADADQTVLLAAADTFRAAAREQLGVWANRNRVEIISQEGADPAAVSFDAVTAGKARKRDVVIADTAGRLPTQLHLMEELKKIRRVIAKADAGAPHEVLLVVDGNTGQNALSQVKAFDDALGLTGLIVTKLDGTAKGGVLAAIARERPIPVYFIGVGEQIEDLQTFSAREFAKALLG